MYQRKDHYYKQAKKEGYASRAAYKLKEIQKKYKILRPGQSVLDLGCAPGGWLQVAAKFVGPKGKVFGIDLLPLKISAIPNVTFFPKDIEESLGENWPPFDVILSDISPDLSGIHFRDTFRSYELACQVWKVAQPHLKAGGHLVVKIFPGEESKRLAADLKKSFRSLETFVPEATRKQSSEVYFVALGFKL